MLSIFMSGPSAQWLQLPSPKLLDPLGPQCYWLPWDPGTGVWVIQHESSLTTNPRAALALLILKSLCYHLVEKSHLFLSSGLAHMCSSPQIPNQPNSAHCFLTPYLSFLPNLLFLGLGDGTTILLGTLLRSSSSFSHIPSLRKPCQLP